MTKTIRANDTILKELEEISGLTSEQAKEYLLKIVEEDVKHETAMIVKEVIKANIIHTLSSLSISGPKTYSITRRQQKTPVFTTATAWSRALTGVGAIIADGSHSWKGIIAALVPKPIINAVKIIVRIVFD